MRLLWLGNSDDFNHLIPEERRSPRIAARIIEERTGEAPELIVRSLWPSATMAESTVRRVEEHDPEMVCLYVRDYAYGFRSVPLRVRRRLRLIGAPLSSAGLKAANSRSLGESRLFHLLRRVALRTVGGDTNFTPDEVFKRTEATVRRILAKEDRIVVVRGPVSRYERRLPKGQPTHLAMTKRLERMCDALHVEFVGWDEPPFDASEPKDLLGDRLHVTEQGHELLGRELGEALAAAWLAVHPAATTP